MLREHIKHGRLPGNLLSVGNKLNVARHTHLDMYILCLYKFVTGGNNFLYYVHTCIYIYIYGR